MPLGREMRRGENVLSAGAVLHPVELGVLAGVGRSSVPVVRAPHVAVLSTGDEVVEAPAVPGPGQIRNSNGPMLTALVERAGGVARYLGNAADRLDSLRPAINEGLKHDALVLCGGVSAGKLDLVPSVLRDAGVEAHFHKVAMKPGKPVLFGTLGRTVVFGLPGNPVSSLACFELFVRPALRRLAGIADALPRFVPVPLVEEFAYRTDRPTYHPAWLEPADVGWQVRRVPWFGSPDLRALTRANALMLLPAGDQLYRAGQAIPVLALD
jgi:molybdopterin molybdotransferase